MGRTHAVVLTKSWPGSLLSFYGRKIPRVTQPRQSLQPLMATVKATSFANRTFFVTNTIFGDVIFHARASIMRGSIRTLEEEIVKLLTAAFAVAGLWLLQPHTARAQRLPYKAVHNPQFLPAHSATFLHDSDRVLGIAVGKTAKAYPAAILAQHGLVEDSSPDGPIAITW